MREKFADQELWKLIERLGELAKERSGADMKDVVALANAYAAMLLAVQQARDMLKSIYAGELEEGEREYMAEAGAAAAKLAAKSGGNVVEGPHHVFVTSAGNKLLSPGSGRVRVLGVEFPGFPPAIANDRTLAKPMGADYSMFFDSEGMTSSLVVAALEHVSGLELGARIEMVDAGSGGHGLDTEHYLLMQNLPEYSNEPRAVGYVSLKRKE